MFFKKELHVKKSNLQQRKEKKIFLSHLTLYSSLHYTSSVLVYSLTKREKKSLLLKSTCMCILIANGIILHISFCKILYVNTYISIFYWLQYILLHEILCIYDYILKLLLLNITNNVTMCVYTYIFMYLGMLLIQNMLKTQTVSDSGDS